jgi:Secretion system C-terminal sorting domain
MRPNCHFQKPLLFHFLIVSLLIFFTNTTFCQNLAPNPKFEDTLSCPPDFQSIADWTSWKNSPDYFHTCANATNPSVGNPVNFAGYHAAPSGNGYIGLANFGNGTFTYREYAGAALTQPMIVGQTYYVSFKASLASTLIGRLATNNLGIRFSTISYTLADPDTINNNPHVFSSAVITDTIGWTIIQGSFIADSAYAFMGIGNYFSDSLTTFIQVGTGPSSYSYYLIDDVCVSTDSSLCMIASGVIELASQHSAVEVYPNPATATVNFSTKHPGVYNLEITDLSGRSVKTTQFAGSVQIDISQFADGMYFYRIWDSENYFTQGRIIKK